MVFTVVCPVHNEEKMLNLTINSIYKLNPDEVLFGLDRCSDGTAHIIKEAKRIYHHENTKLIKYGENDGEGWIFRGAYLRRDLYRQAENDAILNTSADLNLDPIIEKYLREIPNQYGLISFCHWDNPWTYQCFVRRLISNYSPIQGFSGLNAFSKRAWLETEDIEELKKIPRFEDAHLYFAIRKAHPTKHVNSQSLHLRPEEDKINHYNRGQSQWTLLKNSPLKSFIHSVVYLRPAVFAGYCHARRGLVA